MPGYIVNGNNDTIKGLIDFRNDANFVYFKTRTDSPTQKYSPAALKSFKFKDGKLYISKILKTAVENDSKFMEVLVTGTASLFSYYKGVDSHFILEKPDGQVFDFSKTGQKAYSEGKILQYDQSKYTALLRFAFSDYQSIYPFLNQASLGESSLIEIVMKYNRNKAGDQKSVVYKNPLPRMKLRIAPVVSLNSSKLKFNNSYFYENYQTISSDLHPSIGFTVNSEFPRSKLPFSLQISLEFNETSFSGKGISPANSSNEDISINFSTTKGKGGLKYTYPKGKIRPSIMAGINLISISNVSGKITDHATPGESDIQSFKNYMIITNTPLIGYSFDLELGYYGKKRRPFINIGYDNSMEGHIVESKYLFASQWFRNYLTTMHFSAGVYF